MNLYAYVGGNPVNWVDPWGLAYDSFWDRLTGVESRMEHLDNHQISLEESKKHQEFKKRYNEQRSEFGTCMMKCIGEKAPELVAKYGAGNIATTLMVRLGLPQVSFGMAAWNVVSHSSTTNDVHEVLKKCASRDCNPEKDTCN